MGWNFHVSVLVSAVIVLVYIFLGGLTSAIYNSAIYNEVMQFFLIFVCLLNYGTDCDRRRLKLKAIEQVYWK